MLDELQTFHEQVNFTRYTGQAEGHYESFFLRANHPSRPLAFWIRYTIFSRRNDAENAMGELWAVFFNGETDEHSAAKEEFPLKGCLFDRSSFDVRINSATLTANLLQGSITGKKHSLAWDLTYNGNSVPLLLFPLQLYEGKFPAAKSLVSLPLARFSGTLSVNGETIPVAGWTGSQNHNWGSKHTDRYAWGQVAGFDSHPDSFLEVASAQLKLGPVWTPPITLLVLRHAGREYALNEMMQGLKARGKFKYFSWEFASRTPEVEIRGNISAPRRAFVGLNYYNPPGGNKHCLNSKIAACTLQVKDRTRGTTQVLETKHRAAFEILTSFADHGIPISA